MPPSRYTEIAYFLKTHGLKGELKTVLLEDIQFDFTTLDSIFIKVKGQFIPYFIEYINGENSEFIIKLDEVDSPESASELRGERIYVTADKLQIQSSQKPYEDLLNYVAYDQDKILGKIQRLESYPQQMMAMINVNRKEILIPLVEEFILQIDDDKMEIHFQLPDGLLDL